MQNINNVLFKLYSLHNKSVQSLDDETTANFTGALQTEDVRAPPYKHLELHSPTRSVYLQAPEHINLNTKGGDIFVQSKLSASFESKEVKMCF